MAPGVDSKAKSEPDRSAKPLWIRMLYLGDSLTNGARDPYALSWPYYMAQAALDDDVVILPYVESKNGRRSSELVRVSLPAIEKSGAKEAFILIGTNDAKDENVLPVDQYIANVLLIQNWCRVLGIREYVMTIPLPAGFGSPGYTLPVVDRIKEYNVALRGLNLPRLIECEDIRETVDGVHFSADAAKETARRAWEAVKSERTLA
jgi:lysophospholipase L1-like esterase